MNFTSNFNFYLPVHGEYPGSWDIPVNRNFSSIDTIIKSIQVNNKGFIEPDGEIGSTWYNQTTDKLMIKKPEGYFNLIDSENFIGIIGNVVTDDGENPVPPTNLTLVAYPETPVGQVPLYIIEASWNPSDDQIHYPELYHDDFSAYILTLTKDNDSYIDQRISYKNKYSFTNIKPGSIYSVTVQVVDKLGHKSIDSITSSIGVYDSNLKPVSPAGVSAIGAFRGIIVSWDEPLAHDIAGYEIHASEIAGFTPDETTKKYSGISTIATITKGILPNTKYYLKVRTKNRSGNWSDFSSIATATTKGVGTADYDNLSITNAAIADLAVDNAKVSSIDATKIKTGFLDANRIEAESITGEKLAFKSITADKIVGGGEMADVAANKPVSISAGNTINGGMCSYTTTDSGIWQVFSSQFPATATIDIAGINSVVSELSTISFSSYPTTNTNNIPGKFILEYSVDGSIWQEIKTVDSNFIPSALSEISVFIGSVSARFIRITIPVGACQAGQNYVLLSNFKVLGRQGGTLITGSTIKTGSINADHITTTDLSAISANLGQITAGTIDMLSSGSFIRAGQPGFNTGKGFWLGLDNNLAKFSIGDAQGAGIKWDGSKLKITGDVIIGAAPDGTGGIAATDVVDKSYTVNIESTNGLTFKPGQAMNTQLIARVFQGTNEVTDLIDASRFRWRRVSYSPQPPPNDDNTWNALYRHGYKTIDITIDSVTQRATFHCDIMSDNNY